MTITSADADSGPQQPAELENKAGAQEQAVTPGDRAANTVLGRFIIPELRQSLDWVDWEAHGRKPLSAMAALSTVNENHPEIRIDPRVLGGRFALGATDLSQAFKSDHNSALAKHVDRAALLYSNLTPENLSHEAGSPQRLSAVRKTYMDALKREWLKANLFQHHVHDHQDHSAPRFNGFTFENARGKTIKDLAEHGAIKQLAGVDGLSSSERVEILTEWAREKGLDCQHKIGTIEFSLASVLGQRAVGRGEPLPQGLEDRTALLKAFDLEVQRWQEHPDKSFNPTVEAALHLAQSSGDELKGSDEEILNQALTIFSERWNANFGKPPAFNREEAALEILEEMTGHSREYLQTHKIAFSSHHPWGLTETVYGTPLERFLTLADRPGVGHTLVLPCERADHEHYAHQIRPRDALQNRENQYDVDLLKNPWVIARAKENLRLAEKELSEENIKEETYKLVENYGAETENHRHFINGLYFLKDWYISQIPIVGGIYNIEEGIRHHQVKQIIGGGLALTMEVGGFALSMRRGGVSPETGIEAGARGSAPHLVESIEGSMRAGVEESHAPGPVVNTQPATMTDVMAGARPLKMQHKVYTDHPTHGMVLKTWFDGMEQEVTWVGVPGSPGSFRAINPETGAFLTGKIYDIDGRTGAMVPRNGLKGGGPCCSKPFDPEDPPYTPAEYSGINEPLINNPLEQSDNAPTVIGRKGDETENGSHGSSVSTAEEGRESMGGAIADGSDADGEVLSIDMSVGENSRNTVDTLNEFAAPRPVNPFADDIVTVKSDEPPLPFSMRMADLTEEAPLYVVAREDPVTGFQRTAYRQDWTEFDDSMVGRELWAKEDFLTEPIELNGPTREIIKQQGQPVGDDALGQTYLYGGRAWWLLSEQGDAPAAGRAKAAAQLWNGRYDDYAFGRAKAHDLGDGDFAVSTPLIPIKEGFGRAHNEPKGPYGAISVLKIEPIEMDSLPVLGIRPEPGTIADAGVIRTGGHWVGDRVYWYQDEYYTFMTGSTVKERHWNALQFARNWNQLYGKATNSEAVVQIFEGDKMVAVRTRPVTEEALSRAATETASIKAGDNEAAVRGGEEEAAERSSAASNAGGDTDVPSDPDGANRAGGFQSGSQASFRERVAAFLSDGQPVRPQSKMYGYDVNHGVILKTWFDGLEKEVTWAAVPGSPGSFRVIESGTGGLLSGKIYDFDTRTGTLVPREGLKGGGPCCSRPQLPEMDDVPYAPPERSGTGNGSRSHPADEIQQGGTSSASHVDDNASSGGSVNSGDDEATVIVAQQWDGLEESLRSDTATVIGRKGFDDGMGSSWVGDAMTADEGSESKASSFKYPESVDEVAKEGSEGMFTGAGYSNEDVADLTSIDLTSIRSRAQTVEMPVEVYEPALTSADVLSINSAGRSVKPFTTRISELADKAELFVVAKDDPAHGLKRDVFLQDWIDFDQSLEGRDLWHVRGLAGDSVENSRSLATTLQEKGYHVGVDYLGPLYLYEGRAWTVLFDDVPGTSPVVRAKAAARRWNAQYEEYWFGRAKVHELDDGVYAVSTPLIPMREGFGRSFNQPHGKYGAVTSLKIKPVSPDEMPVIDFQPGDIGDGAVIRNGGHRVERGVYWYENEYYTFQPGDTVSERHWHAVQFARNWNEKYGELTNSKAVLQFLPRDGSIVVRTKPLPLEAEIEPALEQMPSEGVIGDHHEADVAQRADQAADQTEASGGEGSSDREGGTPVEYRQPSPIEQAEPVEPEVASMGSGRSGRSSIFDRLNGLEHKFDRRLLNKVREIAEKDAQMRSEADQGEHSGAGVQNRQKRALDVEETGQHNGGEGRETLEIIADPVVRPQSEDLPYYSHYAQAREHSPAVEEVTTIWI
ncbi:hypothetical protein [Rhodoligotrophos defluvii]|uniref:hypothetical protein n=1 Tax=Rhodoligotrophos defluvii TaxID=2561934 RepID=UPI0010C94591|nr:hypothetical protein [Rhodoligotrophos defluvii]